ncbi:hypothetical protein BCS42_04915 [Crenothrix sp. D3]|jgi:hypothetical protein|nr:hypothetical protein BCS42_04915 [Crenothrix sp. D3]
MKIKKVTGLLMIAGLLSIAANAHAEDSFVAHNTTKVAIKQMLVSQDGKTWGGFDIGSGIKAGESVTLVWAASTDNENCKQFVKAVFADGEEGEPVKFDFCEKGLELEF